jgi:hypothetical protein
MAAEIEGTFEMIKQEDNGVIRKVTDPVKDLSDVKERVTGFKIINNQLGLKVTDWCLQKKYRDINQR